MKIKKPIVDKKTAIWLRIQSRLNASILKY